MYEWVFKVSHEFAGVGTPIDGSEETDRCIACNYLRSSVPWSFLTGSW